MRARVRSTMWGVLATLLVAGAAVGQTVCPSTRLSLSGSEITLSVAHFDSTYLLNQLHFDLVPGTLGLAYCCSLYPTYMYVRDAYDVAGVAPGTPVSLTVQLDVNSHVYDAGQCGGTGCSGTFIASVSDGTTSNGVTHSPILFGGAEAFYHDLIELPITITAGAPLTLEFEFWAQRSPGGDHGADAAGTFRFVGVPPGAQVISCQGYAGIATPVHGASWGRLKTLYR